MHIVPLIESSSNIFFHLFAILDFKKRQQSKWAGIQMTVLLYDHKQADLTTYNIEEPQKKYKCRLEMNYWD